MDRPEVRQAGKQAGGRWAGGRAGAADLPPGAGAVVVAKVGVLFLFAL